MELHNFRKNSNDTSISIQRICKEFSGFRQQIYKLKIFKFEMIYEVFNFIFKICVKLFQNPSFTILSCCWKNSEWWWTRFEEEKGIFQFPSQLSTCLLFFLSWWWILFNFTFKRDSNQILNEIAIANACYGFVCQSPEDFEHLWNWAAFLTYLNNSSSPVRW